MVFCQDWKGLNMVSSRIYYDNFLISQIMPLIPSEKSQLLGRSVNTHSVRLRLFKEHWNDQGEIRCVCCGIKATHFQLEGNLMENPHLNLYGGSVLFTKDHVMPRSLGGLDALSNLQVMCKTCNEQKGNLC